MSSISTCLQKVRKPLSEVEINEILFGVKFPKEGGQFGIIHDFLKFEDEFVCLSICRTVPSSECLIGLGNGFVNDWKRIGCVKIQTGQNNQLQNLIFEHVDNLLKNAGPVLSLKNECKISTIADNFEVHEHLTIEAAIHHVLVSIQEKQVTATVQQLETLKLSTFSTRNLILVFGFPDHWKDSFFRRLQSCGLHQNSRRQSRIFKSGRKFPEFDLNPAVTIVVDETQTQYEVVDGQAFEFMDSTTVKISALFFLMSTRELNKELGNSLLDMFKRFPKIAARNIFFGIDGNLKKGLDILAEFDEYYHKIDLQINAETCFLLDFSVDDFLQQLDAKIKKVPQIDPGVFQEFNLLNDQIDDIQNILRLLTNPSAKRTVPSKIVSNICFGFGALIHILADQEMGLESVKHERWLLETFNVATRMHHGTRHQVVGSLKIDLHVLKSELKKISKTCYHFSDSERNFAVLVLDRLKILKI